MRYATILAASAALWATACGGGGGGGGGGSSFGGYDPNHVVVANPGVPADAKFGSAVAWLDWNQDGRMDVVAGAPGQQPSSQQNAGAAFLYTQNVGGTFTLSRTLIASDWSGGAVQAFAFFGETLSVGDFDGDGRPDVAIGAPGDAVGANADAGRVYVLFNDPAHVGLLVGPVADPAGSQAGAEFGATLASGRFDAGVLSDLAVGSPDRTVGVTSLAGRATVLLGTAVPASFGTVALPPIEEAVPEDSAAFGAALAIGDVDLDGLADLVVGVPGASTATGGKVTVWRQVAGPAVSLFTTLTTTESGLFAGFGSTLALADLDGDTDLDIAVGTPFGDVGVTTEAGYVVVFRNTAPGAGTFTESSVHDRAPEFGAQFGGTLAIADATADGIPDLVVGSPAATQGGQGTAGHLTVFPGLGAAAFAIPAVGDVFGAVTPTTDAAFAASLDLADANGDGVPDIVVGAPGPVDDLTAIPGTFEVLKSN